MKTARLFLLLLFAACTRFFDISAQTQADSIAIHSRDNWEVISTPRSGVKVLSGKFANLCGEPQCLSVARISTDCAPGLGIAVSDTLAATSKIATESKAILAVNGSYFDMSRGNSVCFIKIGKEVTDSTTQEHAVNAALQCRHDSDRPVKIMRWSKEDERSYADTLSSIIASGPVLILNGENQPLDCVIDEFSLNRHPRTAVGVTADGSVILLTADGRHAENAHGLTLPQLTWILRQLGAVDAINLDGGGSTAMWTEAEGIVSHPSDNRRFDHGGERRVPNIIYLAQ